MIADKINGMYLSSEERDYNNAIELYKVLNRKPAKERNELDNEFIKSFNKINNKGVFNLTNLINNLALIYNTYNSEVRMIVQEELSKLFIIKSE